MTTPLPAPSLLACLLLLSCLALTACLGGTKPPPTQYYLLRADSPSSESSVSKVRPKQLSSVQISSVTIAPYLNQNGLVMETDNHRIAIARFNQWSEPLSSSIPRFLGRSISDFYGTEVTTQANTQPTPSTTIAVQIDQLHGLKNGDVKLEASWTITSMPDSTGNKSAQQHSYAFEDKISLSSDGYDALVEAEKQLLTKLSRAIAESLPPR